MKKQHFVAGLCAIAISVGFLGCKTNKDLVEPFTNLQQQKTTDSLKLYLSRTLGVAKEEVFYENNTFHVRGILTFDEKELKETYSNANEYKLKYGITSLNTK